MVVCKNDAVTTLCEEQTEVSEDGVNSEEDMPISVLDIRPVDLQGIKQYLTAGAYDKMCLLGEACTLYYTAYFTHVL